MEGFEFSEEDIQKQLALMGYTNISKERLCEFKRDLEELVKHDPSKSHTSSDASTARQADSSGSSPSNGNRASHMQHQFPESRDCCIPLDHGKQTSFSITGKENCPVNVYSTLSQEYDPYSVHTVAQKRSRPTSAPPLMRTLNILHSPGAESSSSALLSDASRNSSPESTAKVLKKPAIQRKILRKRNGESHVYVESSFSEPESDAVSDLGERLSILQAHGAETESDLESVETSSSCSSRRRPYSAHPFLTRDQFGRKQAKSEDDDNVSYRPKSFIRPLMEHPHTRNLKKTDPVAKYFQYKQDWDSFKAPGEKNRKELRWCIREQMLYQSRPPPKPQRIYIPNNYVVPTEKKRSALRWEVRHDLAKGNIPQTFFCPW